MDVVVVGSCNIDLVRYVTLIDAFIMQSDMENVWSKGNVATFILNLGEDLNFLKIALLWSRNFSTFYIYHLFTIKYF